MSKFIDKTLHVAERVRARSPLEIIWHPPGEALPPNENHLFNLMNRGVGFTIENAFNNKVKRLVYCCLLVFWLYSSFKEGP